MLEEYDSGKPMQMRRIDWLGSFEYLFTLGTLYFTTGAINAPLMGDLNVEINTVGLNIKEIANAPTQAPIFLVVQLAIFGLTLFFMALRWEYFAKVMTRPRLVWLYVILSVVSCLWTGDPSASFRRALFLLATTLFGFYFAGRYSLREQMLMVTSALGICVFSHLTFGLLFPAYAQHNMYFAGAWRGLMSHKNSLAQTSVFAAVMFQLVMPFSQSFIWPWVGLITATLMVVLSTSKTGLVTLLLFSLLLPILRLLRAKTIKVQLATLTLVLLLTTIVAVIGANLDSIFLALGRNATLTGRTDIWAVLIDKVSRRPWFGYGFKSFWSGGVNGEAIDLLYSNNYVVDTAHNGFLDIALELGLVGLGIFCLSLLMNFQRSLSWLRQTRSPEGLYVIFVMIYWVAYNLTESTVPDAYSLSWVLYAAVTTSMLIYPFPHEALPESADRRLPRAVGDVTA
jgi:exopolysaccharide production protein ExoQ